MLRMSFPLLLAAGLAGACTRHAFAADGAIDAGWAGVEAGRVRVAFDAGGTNNDRPAALRVLADGRLLAVGTADGSRIAVAVRRADGTPDTGIAPSGRYTVALADGFLSTQYPTAIAADGSYYAIGMNTASNQLRIWHHALDGTPIGTPVDVGVGGRRYLPSAALVDVAGRLLVGGAAKAAAAGDSGYDGFVLRLTAAGALDPAFGLRDVPFDAAVRDDVYAMTEVGDETYAVCGRVGDLSDTGNLRFGVAHLGRSGSLLAAFNGNGMYVDQLALQGHAAESGCTGIAAVPSPQGRHLVLTGRASANGVFPRTFVLALDAVTGATLPGTPDMLDFGHPTASVAFPVIAAGSAQGDRGLVYVAASGTFDASGKYVVAVARLDPVDGYDTGWGSTATGTPVAMTVPAIGGTARHLYPDVLLPAGGRVYLAGSLYSDGVQGDFALVRLAGDTIFTDAFDF